MAEQLKFIYNDAYISKLSGAIHHHYDQFSCEDFVKSVFCPEWDKLELKQRMRHITHCLGSALPSEYDNSIYILQCTIPLLSGHGLENLIFPDYVELYGLNDWEISLPALELFTQFSTSEFAVRPYIMQDKNRMMRQMGEWAVHKNHHVRRLASEGCRPRLPWAAALPEFKEDPMPIVPILDMLKSDDSDYVRKSVANNLNDIAKDHPDLVLELANRWYGFHSNTDWVIKHGCRTLLKKGHKQALELFGFNQDIDIEISDLKLSKDLIAIGESLSFSFKLNATQESNKLRLEYAIDYVKANSTKSRKIFQIIEKLFVPNQTTTLTRNHSFHEMTTRKHYPGIHRLTILVNGLERASIEFGLHM